MRQYNQQSIKKERKKTMARQAKTVTALPYHRLTLRLTEKDFERLEYWSSKIKVSINEFIPILLDRWIAIENGNYALSTLEQQRLNQLIDVVKGLSVDIQNQGSILSAGFESLLQLTKGDNYLFDRDEDGEF